MIEAAQHPFGARHRPEIIGRRQHQHRQQAGDIDRDRGDIERGGIDGGQHDQHGGGDQAEADADDVHDAVGDQFGRGRSSSAWRRPRRGCEVEASCFSLKMVMSARRIVTGAIRHGSGEVNEPFKCLAHASRRMKLDFGPPIATLRGIDRSNPPPPAIYLSHGLATSRYPSLTRSLLDPNQRGAGKRDALAVEKERGSSFHARVKSDRRGYGPRGPEFGVVSSAQTALNVR